jgi:hypothetical protein
MAVVPGALDTGAGHEVDRVRQRHDVVRTHQHVLGRGAVGSAGHPVADGKPVNAFADRVHHTGQVAAGQPRPVQRRAAGQVPATDLPVDRVHPDRMNPDPDLPWTGLDQRHLGQGQDVGVPVFGEDDGFGHVCSSGEKPAVDVVERTTSTAGLFRS